MSSQRSRSEGFPNLQASFDTTLSFNHRGGVLAFFFSVTRFGSPPYRWSCTHTTSSTSTAARGAGARVNATTTNKQEEDDRSRDDLQDDGGFAKLRFQTLAATASTNRVGSSTSLGRRYRRRPNFKQGRPIDAIQDRGMTSKTRLVSDRHRQFVWPPYPAKLVAHKSHQPNK